MPRRGEVTEEARAGETKGEVIVWEATVWEATVWEATAGRSRVRPRRGRPRGHVCLQELP